MEYEEMELLAARGNPLPGHPDLETQFGWTLLRMLYHDYQAGLVDKETAKRKKQEIRRAFLDARELHNQQRAAYAQYQEFLRLGAEYRYKIREAARSGAEPSELARLCLKLYGALTGDETINNSELRMNN